jgi:two-component system response regulator (stage 0 sporulation protein F)
VTVNTVLVVDDERNIRETLEDALRDEGYEVAVASNGREALELLAHLPRPLAVVLDMLMPIMSGREVYQAMQQDPRLNDVPVLISTSDPARAPSGVLTMKKPINLTNLLTTVRSFFDQPGSGGAAPDDEGHAPARGDVEYRKQAAPREAQPAALSYQILDLMCPLDFSITSTSARS